MVTGSVSSTQDMVVSVTTEIASLRVLASDSILDWHQYLSEKALLLTYWTLEPK